MKKNLIRFALFSVIAFACAFSLSAEEEEKSPVSLYLQTDGAYNFGTRWVPGETHFAPVTSVWGGIEALTALGVNYTIPTPLGESWLVKDADVVIGGKLELSPITFIPKFTVDFQPLPFFVVQAGGAFGIGWNMMGFMAVGKFDPHYEEYEKLSTFSNPYYEFWGKTTLMFDTGAIVPGDWTHVVMMASFKTFYSGLVGLDKQEIFVWQNANNKVQGLQYDGQFILGYQMPLPLSLAGVMFEAEGHFDGSDYGIYDEKWDGAFATISLSPVMQFKLGKKDGMTLLFHITSRRSLDRDVSGDDSSALSCTTVGREWYFRRIAFSWTHTFF